MIFIPLEFGVLHCNTLATNLNEFCLQNAYQVNPNTELDQFAGLVNAKFVPM